jgi:hypothetical protein
MFEFHPDGTVTITLRLGSDKVKDIIPGLLSGKYERVGGVVRDSITKQIVAWLREVPGKDVAREVVRALAPLTQVAAVSSVLNLSITAVGFGVVVHRLLAIEKRLKAIAADIDEVDWKVELGFYANMRGALDMANNAYSMGDTAQRNAALNEAVMALLTAEQHFTAFLERDLGARGRLAPSYLNTLVLIHSGIARCYAEIEELDIARKHLTQHVAELRPLVKGYRDAVIGPSLPLYLHPDLKDTVSLVRIAWLLAQEIEGTTPAEAFEQLRKDLWEIAGEGPKSWVKRMPDWMTDLEPTEDAKQKRGRVRDRSETEEERTNTRMPEVLEDFGEDAKQRISSLFGREAEWERAKARMPEVLAQVEEAYEGLNRLRGFGLELDYLAEHGMSFADWQALAPPAGDKEPYYAIVPPDSPLHDRADAAKTRLSAEAQ